MKVSFYLHFHSLHLDITFVYGEVNGIYLAACLIEIHRLIVIYPFMVYISIQHQVYLCFLKIISNLYSLAFICSHVELVVHNFPYEPEFV